MQLSQTFAGWLTETLAHHNTLRRCTSTHPHIHTPRITGAHPPRSRGPSARLFHTFPHFHTQVHILGTQPWPIGRAGTCELMLGCIAKAKSYEVRGKPKP
jgi:hypothetical protein